ncbi:MAG: NAD-glutamate dehydrogenase, partial [Deefgea sp.]
MALNLTLQALQTWSQQTAPEMTAMIQHFYAHVPEEDLQERSIEDLGGAVLAQRRMAHTRSANEKLVRIYNPNLSEHGWQSPHTVIEIVQADMPFLVDSVGIALSNMKCNVYGVIHPVLTIQRNEPGQIVSQAGTTHKESWMHFEINRISDAKVIAAIQNEINQALDSIAVAVADFPVMTERVSNALEQLKSAQQIHPHKRETIAFLEWLLAGHFVFLGLRDYQFKDETLNIIPHSGQGLLRDAGLPSPSHVWSSLSPDLRAVAYSPERLLMLTKSDRRSLIHRSAYLDTVLLRNISDTGELLGELRIVGLYSASAYTAPPRQIPILRQKIDHALAQCNAELTGYRGKALLNVLDTYPRDELIEIEVPELARIANGIVSLHERHRVRAFFRDDIYRRYVSVMVFVPRDNYSTDVRIKIDSLLMKHLSGSTSEFTVFLGDNPLARIHYIIRRLPSNVADYNTKEIESEIAQVSQRWQDDLKQQLIQSCGEERGSVLHQKYLHAFPAAYCADFSARAAIFDI